MTMIQVPRHLILVAEADRRNSKQSCPKRKSIPLWSFFLLLLLNTSHVDCGVLFFSSKFFFPRQQCFGILISGWLCVHQGSHHSYCADTSPFHRFFTAKSSSLGQVDDGYPLVHTAALSAESVHFAQRRVLPRCRMWAIDQDAV